MIETGKIYNEDCMATMKRMDANSIDIVLTSPPYNTGIHGKSSKRALGEYEMRYDVYVDLPAQHYIDWVVSLFNEFDRILKKDGVVLWNLSYGTNRRSEALQADTMIRSVSAIVEKSPFAMGDMIVWKKSNALPNNVSPNSLTRICEYIFVFVRKKEIKTYKANKKIIAKRHTGQVSYGNIYNFIEAKNSDESCPYNKAVFSSDLVCKLLEIYAYGPNLTVYDPFMGSGTTAVGCERMLKGLKWIGSELSTAQCEWATNRIARSTSQQQFQLFATDDRNLHLKDAPRPKKTTGAPTQAEMFEGESMGVVEEPKPTIMPFAFDLVFFPFKEAVTNEPDSMR